MPIYLPPLSRRSFLRRTLLAAAGLGCARQLLAADRRTETNSWIFMADTHIAADAAKVNKSVNMTDHLAAAAKQIMELPARPVGMFVVGDCAFSQGEPGDYAQFTKLLEPLRAD